MVQRMSHRSSPTPLWICGALALALGCHARGEGSGATEAAALPLTVEFYPASGALPPNLPFSEAVRVGNLVILSGQLGIEPGTMQLVEGGLVPEARQTMENIKSTLEANGLSMRDVVKCTVMLDDISQWADFNPIYAEFFEPPYPARSAFGADGLAMGAALEVECQAAIR